MSTEDLAKQAGCSRGAIVRELQMYRLEQEILGMPRIRLVDVLPNRVNGSYRGYGTPVYEISDAPDKVVTSEKSGECRWIDAAQRAEMLDEQKVILSGLVAHLVRFRGNPFALHFVWMGVTA
ncbi:hypothetical protein [Robbsia andropogonis]|uniref:hypothetical protein n=1 Tax=Robbsia andropogonis TaxID=28092 RepID=UPI002A6ACA4E|nr:hypothetical protein [Robbsia andropogonis]